MALATAGVNAAAKGVTDLVGYISLHSSAPNTSGSAELTGGTYARVSVTWGSPSAGVVALSATPSAHNVPASSTVAYVGLWSASTAGTYYGSAQLSASETYTGAGTYQVTALTVTAS